MSSMETINIHGVNRFADFTKVRNACRGIVMRDGMILLTYEVNTDQWFIPGGGLEGEETIQQCCIRELAEETGFVVNPLYQFAIINEFYEEWKYISNYFICEITGETERVLTEREAEVGLEPRWIPLREAVTIFSKHQDYAYDEMKRGGYLREYKALLAFMDAGQGLYELAMKHIYGDSVPEDNELAVKLLTQAHEMDHVEATYNLGICYHYGYGTVVDLAKAYELYLESANGGYGKGMELIGRFYNRGIYVEQDRKQAEYWLHKAMQSADPEAVAEAKKELATEV